MVQEALELSDLPLANSWRAEPTFGPFACCGATEPCNLSSCHQQVLFGLCLEVLKPQAL